MTVVVAELDGVRIAVHRVHRCAGYSGKPFVAQVADGFLLDGGLSGRAKRFTTSAQALQHARIEADLLARRRAALVLAWLG